MDPGVSDPSRAQNKKLTETPACIPYMEDISKVLLCVCFMLHVAEHSQQNVWDLEIQVTWKMCSVSDI